MHSQGQNTRAENRCKTFSEIGIVDADWAGGKGAALGELVQLGMPVPSGFVVGAAQYAEFCDSTGLRTELTELLAGLDAEDTTRLNAAAAEARQMVEDALVPVRISAEISEAYATLSGQGDPASVAVRSSAIGEDAAGSSFAGMHSSYLNVCGQIELLAAVKHCWASLFTARTLYYRATQDLPMAEMDIAVVVQRQLVSKRSGITFTIDPATGDDQTIVIEASIGLGEAIVSGGVSPDRFVLRKPESVSGVPMLVERDVQRKQISIDAAAGGGTVTRTLGEVEGRRSAITDNEAVEIARVALRIEEHAQRTQDIEWAFDEAGVLWILQARPVTATGGRAPESDGERPHGLVILHGIGAGPGRAVGAARLIESLDAGDTLQDGEVLVAHTTAPDWVPLMRKASAIVTDTGGVTCHAAIVARELGIPCIVGTGNATTTIENGQVLTIDAAAGEVLSGAHAQAAVAETPADTEPPPDTRTKILVNLSDPAQIEQAAAMNVDGVGLLRAELLVVHALGGIHPRLLVEQGRGDEFVDQMSDALEQFAAAFAPRPITYRTIDFRTNEFRDLEGGERFEPVEANPMIGMRGVQRYLRDPDFFLLELSAIRKVWENGHHNLHVMLPFVRTVKELRACSELLEQSGLPGLPGFELWVMAEVPSVLFNLDAFVEYGVKGISIGSNDLTQLMLGIDRDSESLAEAFDARDPAVLEYIRQLIEQASARGLQTSICGQAPSIYPEYAALLVEAGIDAISVSSDAVDATRRSVAKAESEKSSTGGDPERNAAALKTAGEPAP